MRRLLRQAGTVGHHGTRLAGTLLLVALLLAGGAAWRLSQGPVDLPPLAARIGAAVSAAEPGLTVTVGRAGLAWEGFHQGGAPLDLRLADIVIHNRNGVVTGRISRLRVTLAMRALLAGRIAPVRIIAREPEINLHPALEAANGLALPPEAVGGLLRLISVVPRTGSLDLAQLRLIRIASAHLAIKSPAALPGFAATDGRLLFTRQPDGTMRGTASAHFRHGTAIVPLSLTVTGRNGAGRVTMRAGPADPAVFLPADNALAGLDLPVTLSASWPVGRFSSTPSIDLGISAGGGSIGLGAGHVPVMGIAGQAVATGDKVRLTGMTVHLAGPNGTAGPRLDMTGAVALRGPLPGILDLRIDRVKAALLARYWPAGVAKDARAYVTRHVIKGVATDGAFHATFDLGTGEIAPGAVTGGFRARGVTLDWFDGAPPITGLAGTLRFTKDDALEIVANTGRLGTLAVHGHMRITTLSRHDQTATIATQADGDVQAAIRILRGKPLQLETGGFPLERARGKVTATIDATVPLKKHLSMAQVGLKATARLSSVRLPLPVAHLALEGGDVDLDVDPHRLALHGTGTLDGSKARFTAGMKLPGGAFRLDATTMATRRALAAFGVDTGIWRTGTAPLAIAYREGKAGGSLDLSADLKDLALAVPAFGWHKAAGSPGRAELRLGIAAGQPDGLEAMDITAPGLTFRGMRRGQMLAIKSARIGALAASGTLTPPARPGLPWHVALAGDTLDLSGLIKQARAMAQASGTAGPRTTAAATGPAWQLQCAFDHLRLHDRPAPALGPVQIEANGTGNGVSGVTASVRVAADRMAHLTWRETGAETRIGLDAADAGALMAAANLGVGISGGTLTLAATRRAGQTKGRAELADFRLKQAPVMAKVLQGLTIYGIPAATSGPGMDFTQLVAPFRLDGSILTLKAARAWSPSLGFTATGQIELGRKRYNLSGTIVPAYAVNTLPGRIPLIGRLFSPEKGGGLFAARYTVDGPFAAPRISIDPVSALAPGFIRDLFGIGPPDKPAKP